MTSWKVTVLLLQAVFGKILWALYQSINEAKQIVTINVELFGRETPVEISFAEVKSLS